MITTDVALTVRLLRAGGLAAIPTETVYGVAADAEQPAAVARIFAIKGRPSDHPLIVHLGSAAAMFDGWIDAAAGAHVVRTAERLASTCWPGPLTMLVPRGARVIDEVTGGRPTVGLRVPAHRDAQLILAEFGGGLAAPSANRFGRVSPTTAQHVIADLGDQLVPGIDVVFDGGRSEVGVESTIVDLAVWPPQVLRGGAISADAIAQLLELGVADPVGPRRASGMLASHYSPECQVLLADSADDAIRIMAEHTRAGRRLRIIDRTDDVVSAAFELYSDLRAADADDLDALVMVLPPAVGIGHAVRDRLVKAAAGSGRRSNRAD